MSQRHTIALASTLVLGLILVACGGGTAATTTAAMETTTTVAAVHSTGAPDWRSSELLTPHPLGETDAPLAYYAYLPPSYDEGDASPLLVYLHGLNESGDGTEAQLKRLLADGGSIPYLINSNDWPAERPFVVLAPQHPSPVNDDLYAACFEGPMPGDCALPLQTENGHAEGNSICHRPAAVHEFIAYAVDTYDVDPDRVYLTGLSCGGYAAFEYAAEHGASQIAAMVPIAGEGRLAWTGLVALWETFRSGPSTATPTTRSHQQARSNPSPSWPTVRRPATTGSRSPPALVTTHGRKPMTSAPATTYTRGCSASHGPEPSTPGPRRRKRQRTDRRTPGVAH